MTKFRDLISSNAGLLALVAALAAFIVVLAWRARHRRKRREQRRVRRLARQRVWDWLMMRSHVRRLTHQPNDDPI
ncbi:hypothetical protein [Sphingomonas sp.]|jgi:hypothetical protein|uniref:hypothetical protein n=1 Tax=Sphingomonas sp. TaxID=28214 RepID=UPI003BA9BF69